MRKVSRWFGLSLCVSVMAGAIACGDPQPQTQGQEARQAQTRPARQQDEAVKPFDLDANEKRGGHILERHVGKTDAQLIARLQEEPNISAASTYTDKATAAEAIAAGLEQRSEKVDGWVRRRNHPNLVVDYYAKTSVGKTMRRGDTTSTPCLHSVIVLKWDRSDYYVLTSYPECR